MAAKEYKIPVATVTRKYYRIKILQSRLYINHISVVNGLESTSQIRKNFYKAYNCYQDLTYACAYLEKKYNKILAEYRAGEPGMPARFINDIPPLRPDPGKEIIDRIVRMREAEKASYAVIAKELLMTPAKAKSTYEWFYHRQVLALIRALEEKTEGQQEKAAIREVYFKRYKTSKKRYDTNN